MNFNDAKKVIEPHVMDMFNNNSQLYIAQCDGDDLYNLYLDSIPPQHNKIYRQRREYDCYACKHFIKRAGVILAIHEGKLESVWDVKIEDANWQNVFNKMSEYVKRFPIKDIFVSKFDVFGTDHTMEGTIRWNHFCAKVPSKFIDYNPESRMAGARDKRHVLKRGLDDLSDDAFKTVIDLINQGSLYRGNEHSFAVNEFYKLKKDYEKAEDKELFAWEIAAKISDSVAKIRNTSIGTLLIDISDGVELDEAVRRYESVVAPENYKRSKPIFTKRMLDDAKKTITELGYYDSLQRRYANANDISVNNILFINRDTAKRAQDAGDLFSQMSKDVKGSEKKFSKVEEIGIEDFVKNVLPTATDVEAYVENRHSKNLMSLIAPMNPDSKTMFKWNNNFSWAYTGNMTDSMLKENVKKAGGKVDGTLRFSIQWNDLGDYNQNDEDAHCKEPNGHHIYYANKINFKTGGNLDVDIVRPKRGIPAVENITWPDKSMMVPGVYNFFVHTFSARGGHGGFRAEIEFDGQIYSYDYNEDTRKGQNVYVAQVTLNKDGSFSIKHDLPLNVSTREIWGVSTNTFVPVSVVCYSPNYWDEQSGIGNKHYFFMLKDCVNPELPNAWYNEFLNSDLYPNHRKVMEALASKAHVQECDDQLSGLGFSSTQRNDLVVKVKGNVERVLRVKF